MEINRLWDYATSPECKAILANSDYADVENRKNGRIGVGSAYYCAHGDSSYSLQTIIDWKPPEEYTFVSDPFLGMTILYTTRLSPTPDDTKVTYLVGKGDQGSYFHFKLIEIVAKLFLGRIIHKSLDDFEALILNDLSSEMGTYAHPQDLSSEDIERSLAESLSLKLQSEP